MDISLRLATLQDSQFLFDLRNDSVSRASSFNSDLLQRPDHENWLKAALSNSRRKIWIAERAGQKIGMVRADQVADGESELSWNVAAFSRGTGVGTAMLAKAIDLLSGKLTAKVKKENTPSQRMVEKLGFRLSKSEENFDSWVLQK